MRAATSAWVLAIALSTLMPCAGLARTQETALPDWAKEVAAHSQKSYETRTHAVVLLDERTIKVNRSGEYEETVRRVVRILRPEGKNEGSVRIYVDGSDALLNAHAWCSSPDGHNYEVKQKQFTQVGNWSNGAPLYQDAVQYTAEVPGSNPGAVVAFEYTVRYRAWGDYATWNVQEDIPVEEARLKLMLPEKWSYKAFWVNSAPVAPLLTAPGEWNWGLHDLAPIDLEEKHAPKIWALAARMQLAFSPKEFATPVFASWESIGTWAEELTLPRRPPSAAITAKVHELTVGATDFDGIVNILGSYVQKNIHYVAIEIGIGGLQPHAAGDTYRNGYGDCKDKATLLASMLQVAGISSEDVLIFNAHGVTQKDAPGNDFNHAILAIELPPDAKLNYRSVAETKTGKRYLIFDPTNEWIPVGNLPEYEQGNFALLEGTAGGELIRMPVFPPEQNRMTRSGRFTISDDGGLSGELLINQHGSHAWRSRATLDRESERERIRIAERFLSRSVQGATLKQTSYENVDPVGLEFNIRYSFTALGFMRNNGPLLLFKPCVFGEKAFLVDWKKRKYPVDLGSTTDEVDRYEIVLPTGLDADELPDTVELDVGFASYKSSVSIKSGMIVYEREYVVRDPQVGIENLEQLRKLEEAIMRDESATVVLKKKS